MSNLKPCDACCGTGGPSPWEYDYFVWKDGVPHAVCGGCRGSGLLNRFGFRVGQSQAARMHSEFHADPAAFVRFLRHKASGIETRSAIDSEAGVARKGESPTAATSGGDAQ